MFGPALSRRNFDAAGNMTQDQNYKYTYDAWNRLITVKSLSGSPVATYAYDGQNHRISKTVGTTTTDYFYNASWQVLEEKQGTTVTADYVWSQRGLDIPVVRFSSGQALYYCTDDFGNVTSVVNASGTVIERYVYDPYGGVTFYTNTKVNGHWQMTHVTGVTTDGTVSALAVSNEILWKGERYDPETRLYQDRNREYDPALGTFKQRDSVGYSSGSMNLYAFAGADPIAGSDPTGMCGESGSGRDVSRSPGNRTMMLGGRRVVVDEYGRVILEVTEEDVKALTAMIDGGAQLPGNYSAAGGAPTAAGGNGATATQTTAITPAGTTTTTKATIAGGPAKVTATDVYNNSTGADVQNVLGTITLPFGFGEISVLGGGAAGDPKGDSVTGGLQITVSGTQVKITATNQYTASGPVTTYTVETQTPAGDSKPGDPPAAKGTSKVTWKINPDGSLASTSEQVGGQVPVGNSGVTAGCDVIFTQTDGKKPDSTVNFKPSLTVKTPQGLKAGFNVSVQPPSPAQKETIWGAGFQVEGSPEAWGKTFEKVFPWMFGH